MLDKNKILVILETYYTKYEVKLLDRIFISLPKIETDRLVLRKLEYSDKDAIFAYAQNPKIAEHVLWEEHKTELDTIEFLNIIYSAYNKNNAAPWGIQLKNDETIIGTIGFVHWDKKQKAAEVGYALSQKFWKSGIISEAIKEVLKFGFTKMELTKITARCKPENIASIKVLEKCGFQFEEKYKMLIKGKFCDVNSYFLIS